MSPFARSRGIAGVGSDTNRVQIATAGGAQATWRADGKELFFLDLDGTLNAVSFTAVDEVAKRGPRSTER